MLHCEAARHSPRPRLAAAPPQTVMPRCNASGQRHADWSRENERKRSNVLLIFRERSPSRRRSGLLVRLTSTPSLQRWKIQKSNFKNPPPKNILKKCSTPRLFSSHLSLFTLPVKPASIFQYSPRWACHTRAPCAISAPCKIDAELPTSERRARVA